MTAERIGIVFVHGIGEQRRFQHLDAEIRPLIDAIGRREGKPQMTVEITGGTASTLHADQDTWSAQTPIRIVLRDSTGEKELFLHEVWWADVNEPYSFKKELRFWGWGLSVWSFPRKLKSRRPGAVSVMAPPSFKGGLNKRDENVARLKLFGASNVFLMGAFTVGIAVFLARRLLNLSSPNLVRVFVNYLSAVRLYNQKKRADGGFLDAYKEPPRISVRRRMIRTMADVAPLKYDRWYVFAHSLGAVVAYNGLMENAHALPNYLDEERWKKLDGKFGGPARDRDYVGPINDMLPARPLWLGQQDVVYRDKLLQNFRGLLTYGAPLDKFATIWPARVPINIGERDFRDDAEWINVYDPIDPVGASLQAFGSKEEPVPAGVLAPMNYGYRAHWALLYGHLCYLRIHEKKSGDTTGGKVDAGGTPDPELSDVLAEWILTGKSFPSLVPPDGKRWFLPGSPMEKARTWGARAMWVIVYVLLTLSAAWAAPYILGAFLELVQKLWPAAATWVTHLSPWFGPFAIRFFTMIGLVAVVTFSAGWFARQFVFERDPDDPENTSAKTAGP
jgi:hypothetical protein